MRISSPRDLTNNGPVLIVFYVHLMRTIRGAISSLCYSCVIHKLPRRNVRDRITQTEGRKCKECRTVFFSQWKMKNLTLKEKKIQPVSRHEYSSSTLLIFFFKRKKKKKDKFCISIFYTTFRHDIFHTYLSLFLDLLSSLHQHFMHIWTADKKLSSSFMASAGFCLLFSRHLVPMTKTADLENILPLSLSLSL